MNDKIAEINSKCTACNQCIAACPFDAIEKTETDEVIDLSAYKHIWVYAEQRAGKLMNVALELLGEGYKLAKDISEDTKVYAVLIGDDVKGLADECYEYGAEGVICIEDPLLKNFTTDGYTKVLTDAIKEYKPEIVLFGATHIGRDLAPRVAARLNAGLTADCTHLDVKVSSYIDYANKNTTLDTSTLDPDDPDRGIKQTRPAFGGNLMYTCDALDGDTIVGFENHSGKTYLGEKCVPIGKVLSGSGNNGEDGTEGCHYKNVFGCYTHVSR